MNIKKAALFTIPLSILLAMAGCNLFAPPTGPVSSNELTAFQKTFMSSYYVERGGRPGGARALTPFVSTVSTAPSGARATVPVLQLTSYSFSNPQPNPLVGYPEPGLTSSFTVTPYDAANHVYDVVVTTKYPATDAIKDYVEEYYVRDIGKNASGYFDPATPDGKWTVDDPIVKLAGGVWVQDQMARVRQILTFTDGTTRNEQIITQTNYGLPTPAPKFASFDVNSSLDYSQLFVPASDSNAVFSSVVMYSVTPATTSNFWFWQGSQAQSILGIRYYTEFKDTVAGKYYTYTVLFEKTLDALSTTGVSTPQVWSTVFVSSQFDTLAESVLRQQVTFNLDANGNPSLATGVKTTNMQTRVANIAGLKDFYLQQMNTDYVTLRNWDTTTIYTPTGDVAEITAADSSKFLYSRTFAGGAGVSTTSGLGDLASLYTSLQTGAANVQVTTTPLPNGPFLSGTEELQFNGTNKGTEISYDSKYELYPQGTIEAWIYIKQQMDTAGIVHKGVKADFTDECYSLQFWGNQGQLALVLDGTGGASYDLLTSTINLNTGKWYYIVATWDRTASPQYMKLYIDGSLNNSMTPTVAGAPQRDPSNPGLLIGSQLPSSYSPAYGYFTFNGALYGVKVYSNPLPPDEAAISSFYAANKGNTTNWPHP
jgi:hypothetical protein